MNTAITSARYAGNGQRSSACHGLQGMHGIIVNTNERTFNCLLYEEDGMSDLIDRQEAIDAIKELCEYYTPTKSVKHPHMDFVIEQLEELPSAQPEIIRCKDCKYFERDIHRRWGTYNGCGVWTDDGNEIEVKPDDYCSYAVRGEE